MNPHASLNESNLRERDIDVSWGFGFHFGKVRSIGASSAEVNWTVLGVDIRHVVVVKKRRRSMSINHAASAQVRRSLISNQSSDQEIFAPQLAPI